MWPHNWSKGYLLSSYIFLHLSMPVMYSDIQINDKAVRVMSKQLQASRLCCFRNWIILVFKACKFGNQEFDINVCLVACGNDFPPVKYMPCHDHVSKPYLLNDGVKSTKGSADPQGCCSCWGLSREAAAAAVVVAKCLILTCGPGGDAVDSPSQRCKCVHKNHNNKNTNNRPIVTFGWINSDFGSSNSGGHHSRKLKTKQNQMFPNFYWVRNPQLKVTLW